MPRSQNSKITSKKHDEKKIVTYVQNAGMLELKQYLKRHKNANLNFRVDARGRTVLHIAGILGDDGIIRTLLDFGADPKVNSQNKPHVKPRVAQSDKKSWSRRSDPIRTSSDPTDFRSD